MRNVLFIGVFWRITAFYHEYRDKGFSIVDYMEEGE